MNGVKILWLYDDLLDLYGDWANLLAITKGLDAMEIPWKTDKRSLGEPADISRYQLVYLGPGKARNLKEAAVDFKKRQDNILAAVENGTTFLVTGNSRLLFGKSFNLGDGRQTAGVGLFDYTGEETGEVFVCDVVSRAAFDEKIEAYGFINRTAKIHGSYRDPLFWVEKGQGDGEINGRAFEGNLYKNYFGTWQLGPVLVKNPLILKEILRRITGENFRDWNTTAEELALRMTLSEM